MSSLGTPVLLLIFAAAAVAIWVAGVQLSNQTDVLSTRLHLGSAMGGLILLALATNLPEIAIVASASLSGDVGAAVGNILVEGLAVVSVLAVVVAGTQLPDSVIVWRVTPEAVLIAAVWIVSLLLVQRAGNHLPWHESGEAPDDQAGARGHSRRRTEQEATAKGIGTARSGMIFAAAALVTLVAGVILERSGTAIATDVGRSGVLFGATVLAAATSLRSSRPA